METEFEKASYPSREEIEARAYSLWEAEGRQQGRDWEYWLRAEAELRGLPAFDGAAQSTEGTQAMIPEKQFQAPTLSESPRLSSPVSGNTKAPFSAPKKRSTTPKPATEGKTMSKRRRGE